MRNIFQQRDMQDPEEMTLIAGLEDRIETMLGQVLPDLSSFALVDFPKHDNVGDSAIWLGEVAYLAARGVRPSYVCTFGDYVAEELRRAVPEGPILIHGGGNFGDIWPAHQAFRETLLAQFPDRQIIQLPQSLHFGSEEALKRTAAAIERHGKFHLFVRDRRSYEIAVNAFDCPVELCPDSALYLGPLARPVKPSTDLFCLMRTDRERNEASAAAMDFPPEAVIGDWVRLRRHARTLNKVSSMPLNPFLSAMGRKYQFFNALANCQLRRGAQLLSSGRFVLTDRLHAHIIALLLQIPHVVLDNSYGKVSGFVEQWTSASKLVHVARDLPGAFAIYRAVKQDNWSQQAAKVA